jgi:acetyltransferase
MTTRNLTSLFSPRAVALLGASNDPGSVGQVVAHNLTGSGFAGSIMLVNPHAREVGGVATFASVADLPATPDLAVIATPPKAVPQLIAELGARGCRAAVIITAGFDRELRDATLAAARPYLMRIVGPNSLGFLSPVRGINASFSHGTPTANSLALVTQSGAIATSMIDWAVGRDVGFSHIISLGDMVDVDFGDLLDFLATDTETSAILLYAETVTQARKFMSAGRIAARAKPVIVVKGGRSHAGAAAALSHTGAMAGADVVYDAAFRRAGMLRVRTLRELFDAAETLASGLKPEGNRLTIVTNGGGLGVLAADALELAGGRLSCLSAGTQQKLDAVLPATWSHANPVDIIGDAPGSRYQAALDIVLQDENTDAVLVLNCPTGVADSMEAAQAVAQAHAKAPLRPLIGCWAGEATTAAPRALLGRARIPTYGTPDEAVAAFLHLADYSNNQKVLFETPATCRRGEANSVTATRDLVRQVIAGGRNILTEPEAKAVLEAYNIPVVATRVVRTPAEAAEAADAIGAPVVLKVLSRQITHKSDVGGVVLDLPDGAAMRIAAQAMLGRVKLARPDAVIDGFSVQKMIHRPQAQELLLGVLTDPTFGPCILFGHGGVATEIIGDRCVGLPPLSATLAKDMISQTRVARLLAGFRNRKAADLDAIASAIVSLSDLITDVPEIAELDINPLLADAGGVLALDARIVVRDPAPGLELAIRPYPTHLCRPLAGFPTVTVRPIKPEDSARIVEMASDAKPEYLKLRFHGGVALSAGSLALRMSQIDYDREMTLVAEAHGGEFEGVVRLVFDPDFVSAEIAIIMRKAAQQPGIAPALMTEALSYARTRGAQRVWVDVTSGNDEALTLGRSLGGRISRSPVDAAFQRIEYPVQAPRP